jgi:hypothetical protein
MFGALFLLWICAVLINLCIKEKGGIAVKISCPFCGNTKYFRIVHSYYALDVEERNGEYIAVPEEVERNGVYCLECFEELPLEDAITLHNVIKIEG